MSKRIEGKFIVEQQPWESEPTITYELENGQRVKIPQYAPAYTVLALQSAAKMKEEPA